MNQRRLAFETPESNLKSVLMLENEIPGAAVYRHSLDASRELELAGDPGLLRVFLLIEGSVVFSAGNGTTQLAERSVFVARPADRVKAVTRSAAQLLEIQWRINDEERRRMESLEWPIARLYKDAIQYMEPCKSEKTISRELLGHHLLPRFCMGSVESVGFDRVEPHEHPLLDQFFYSFPEPENDIDLLIDGERYPYGANTLLHIPLGSNHGAEVAEGKKMHYLWIDFLSEAQEKQGLAHLDRSHIPTDMKREL